MSVATMADDEHQHHFQQSPPTTWGPSPHIYPHSHHGTPAQEFSGFSFGTPPMPMDHNGFANPVPQRPLHQQLQPLIMPQWPSMLNSQSHGGFQPMYPQQVQPIQPMALSSLPTPVSATSSRSLSTPRKTLTDLDRKRMCQYAEENPSAKQTEIGARFGVERSTVSKVLRQKEKYLLQDDGSRSPVKRAKGRSPDVERALAVWAKNQERKGLPLTDEHIREKARAFCATSASPESHSALTASWIEKFKLKNNLMGARSRKGSLIPEDDEDGLAAVSESHTPNGTSPISPHDLASPEGELHSEPSHESLQEESSNNFFNHTNGAGPFHSQSHNSLHSAFTDTAPSSFSPTPLSPTTSPFFTPDSGTAPGPFIPQHGSRTMPIAPSMPTPNSHRPRSQTFPLLDQYMTGVAMTADDSTPKYVTSSGLDSPMEEPPDPMMNLNSAMHGIHGLPSQDLPIHASPHHVQGQQTLSPSDAMGPPTLPASAMMREPRRRSITPATSSSSLQAATSPDEARKALEVVLSFFEQQPNGFLDLQESMMIGKLMEKLKLQQARRGSNN